jgi:hypothetical protein
MHRLFSSLAVKFQVSDEYVTTGLIVVFSNAPIGNGIKN